MATTTTKTNKPILPRGADNRPVDSYNRAKLFSGKALDFDGVNDVVTTGQNLGNLQTLSIAMHCRIDNMTDGTARGVISQWDNSNGWMIYKSSGTSSLTFWKNGSSVINWDESTNYSDQWIHLVYVIEQGVGNYIYVNGVLVGSDTTNTSDIDYTNNPTFKVGAYGNTSTGFFNGAVGGVKVFNTALTAAQVADLYNNPEKVVPTGVDNTALKLWLPMQEGAGTTAYDGSGNGNHGTISGATWTHGIGAPVAQTAVIDWNKGTNLLKYSEQLNQISGSTWITTDASVTANDTTAPDGNLTADKIEFTTTSGIIREEFTNVASALHIGSVFLKNDDIDSVRVRLAGGAPDILGRVDVDLVNGTLSTPIGDFTPTIENVGNGWYKVAVGDTGTATIASPSFALDCLSSTGSFYAWGAQVEASDSLGAYIPTLATAQTSPVLLPQGLTTGRDITGVNLFENVRKQGALNLDGKSWAEVHDNESLDFGTGSFTLEAWVKIENINTGAGINAVFGLGGNATAGNTAYIETNAFLNSVFRYNTAFSVGPVLTRGDWAHIVGTFDGTNTKIYSNGVPSAPNAATAVDVTNSEVKLIGRDSAGTRYYKDQIAQPRIYNRALTAEEVLNNYNATSSLYI